MRTEAHPRLRSAAPGIGALALAAFLVATPVEAQLRAGCAGEVATPELIAACAGAVDALQGIRDGLGVGHAGAAALPGTATALGRRFGSTPRIALAARMGVVRFDRIDPDRWSSAGRTAGWTPVFGASAGVGVFDGFSVAPTVGGVLGIDLLGDVSTVRLPSGDGFEEASLAWGYGIRVGLLRESFTLPGASLSLMRRSGSAFRLEGAEGVLDADVTTTSVRAAIGKELLGFGLSGGVGWDRASAEGTLQANPSGAPGPTVAFDGEDDTRFVIFGGVTRTFLVTSVGADFGWSDRVAFGSITLRLTI